MVTTSPARRSRVTFPGSGSPLRRLRPLAPAPLADDREPAVLEGAELADDAAAAVMTPATAGACAEPVPLDAQRVLQLERLHRRRERVRHRDVHGAGAVRVWTRAL